MHRHAAVVVDLDAIAHNVGELRRVAGSAEVCAVVKADGYGHGAVEVARAALGAGATRLAVALVEEAAVLRAAGVDAPILLLSEPPADALAEAWALGATPTLYHPEAVATAAAVVPADGRWGVHVKVDTGMHRVGVQPEDAVDLAAAVLRCPQLVLEGTFTHLAVADEPDRPETELQLDRFDAVVAAFRGAGIDPGLLHAANSAGCIAHPRARMHMVRCGIAVYGLTPSDLVGGDVDLRPAMSVVAEVSHVAPVAAGEGVSYGLRHRFTDDTVLATVPVGYADGVPRRLWEEGGEVLIGGVPRPVRGVVTMDQLVVEVGRSDAAEVRVGDEVVLLGSQDGPRGRRTITADDWARRLGTINYEVVCALSLRLGRRYVG